MARNIGHIIFGLPDPADNSNFSRQEGESREEFRERVRQQAEAASAAAKANAKEFQRAKEAGLVKNAAEWDEYLVNSGRATDIEKVNGGFIVNGTRMSDGEYADWCDRHGRG